MSDRTSRYGAFRSRRDGGDEYAKSRDAERGNRREKENVFLLLENMLRFKPKHLPGYIHDDEEEHEEEVVEKSVKFTSPKLESSKDRGVPSPSSRHLEESSASSKSLPADKSTISKMLERATYLKRYGDQNSEVKLEYHLQSGLKFLEVASLLEKDPSRRQDCLAYYKSTETFFVAIAQTAFKLNDVDRMSLCYMGRAFAMSRRFKMNYNGLAEQRKNLYEKAKLMASTGEQVSASRLSNFLTEVEDAFKAFHCWDRAHSLSSVAKNCNFDLMTVSADALLAYIQRIDSQLSNGDTPKEASRKRKKPSSSEDNDRGDSDPFAPFSSSTSAPAPRKRGREEQTSRKKSRSKRDESDDDMIIEEVGSDADDNSGDGHGRGSRLMNANLSGDDDDGRSRWSPSGNALRSSRRRKK